MKILLIRFSSIGDIVLTSPVIRCAKQQLPNAEIHFLTKWKFSDLLSSNPYIDKLHLWQEGKESDCIQQLVTAEFDYVIDLHGSIRSRKIALRLRRSTITYKKLNKEKWLLTNLKINRMPDKHLVDRYFEAISKLGIANDSEGLDLFIPKNFSLSEEVRNKISFAEYQIVVPQATHNTKSLSPSKLLELLKALSGPIILLGGEDARQNMEVIREELPSLCVDLCGQNSMIESAKLIENAQRVITVDTGMMHIAAAFKKPIISIWGSTSLDFGMYPYYGKHEISHKVLENKSLACRPCHKHGRSTCPQKHFKCIDALIFKNI